MTTKNPMLTLFAQAAANHGDNIISERLNSENHLPVSEAVQILAQSPNYKKILPAALEAYMEHGKVFADAISSFPDLEKRLFVAKELSDLLEENENIYAAASSLMSEDTKEQIKCMETMFKKSMSRSDNPAGKLAIINAIYDKKDVTDHIMSKAEANDPAPIIRAFEILIKDRVFREYKELSDEILKAYAELEDKNHIRVLHTGLKQRDVELTRALRSFVKKYESVKIEDDHGYFTPEFDGESTRITPDMVKRIENLFKPGNAGYVGKIVRKVNGDRRVEVSESVDDLLDAAEKLRAAELPEEVYISIATEFEGVKLSDYAKRILQEPVLAKIRDLKKSNFNLAIAAIAYTACKETDEDVRYVADNITKITQLGKSKPIIKCIMDEGRIGRGAKKLKAYLPAGVELSRLTPGARIILRTIGNTFNGNLEDLEILHDEFSKVRCQISSSKILNDGPLWVPYAYGDSQADKRKAYRNWMKKFCKSSSMNND